MESEQNNLPLTIEKNKNRVKDILSFYQDLTVNEKYDILSKELDSLIIDIKGEKIDVILDYTSSIFIQIGINIGDFDKREMMNKLAKLYHKLKNLYFFNILIFLFKKIEKILQIIYDSYDKHFVNFEVKNDFILTSIYDYEQNINNEYKSVSINIKSTNIQKYKFLCNILEEIEIKEDIYRNYILLRGDLDEGCTLKVKFNDDYLLLNNNLNKLKELLKNYGIENRDWDSDRRKPNNLLSSEEKKQKDELKNKKEEENKEKLSNALIIQENFVKNNFKNTKKNTKLFKNIFSKLEEIILSDEKIKNKIIKILPYGSVTQCTCNENSDLEMTILTKNYEKCNEKFIFDLFEKILDNISKNPSSEFDPYLEGIRTTKRTILCMSLMGRNS